MSYNIILNSSNLVGTNGVCNQYKYNFIGGSFTVPEDTQISLASFTIAYSWYNITSALGNNTFSYSIPTTGATIVTVTVTIPDGFYTLVDLNNILSLSLRQNNYYFYNITTPSVVGFSNIPASQIIYPIQFTYDTPNYTNAITFQYIPTSAPNVISQFGTGWVWALGTFPTNAQVPTLTIPQTSGSNITISTYGIGNMLGFTNGVYPSSAPLYYALASTWATSTPTLANSYPVTIYGNTLKTYSYPQQGTSALTVTGANPPFTALGSAVNGVIVRCNLVENNVSTPSDIMDSFPITSFFGSNINYLPIANNFVKMKEGKFQSLLITLNDQNFNVLNALDPNVLISIMIKFPDKPQAVILVK